MYEDEAVRFRGQRYTAADLGEQHPLKINRKTTFSFHSSLMFVDISSCRRRNGDVVFSLNVKMWSKGEKASVEL